MPITTPASTPAESTPTIAATAIQKSNRATRCRRRSSGMSIIPNTTASMMIAASTGFRQVREQRREQDQRRQDEHPGGERRDGRRRTGRLVQRARGEAGRHRHPLEHARAEVRHSLRDRLLIHVDAVAVPGREDPGVAGGLREPDQQQRDRRDRDLRRSAG